MTLADFRCDARGGQSLQTDPVGYRADMNVYAYVRNDPVNGVDPTGLEVRTSGDCSERCRVYDETRVQVTGIRAARLRQTNRCFDKLWR